MDVSLAPELEQFVSDKVKAGLYETAGEVIRDGLRLLNERDRQTEALRSDIRLGFEAVESGGFSEFDHRNIGELADRVKARGRRRLAGESKTGSL